MAVVVKLKKQKEPALKRFFGNFTEFFKNLKSELGRITWPSVENTKKATIAVFVFCAILMAYIFVLDSGFQWLSNYFFGVK